MTEFDLLFDLNSHHVDEVTTRIIKDLTALNDPNVLQSGEDTILKNTWEEICVQVQGEESIYWDIYEETIYNFIKEELEKMPPAISNLICYFGSINNFRLEEEEEGIFIGDGEDEIYRSVMKAAGDYTNKRIENYLDPSHDDQDEDEDEDEAAG